MNLLNQFEEHLLKNAHVSKKTLRNYRSDLSHFTNWATIHLSPLGTKIESAEEILPHFSETLVKRYKVFHLETHIPTATLNRRLSTLRNFGRFLVQQNFVLQDPTITIENGQTAKIQETLEEKRIRLVSEFKQHLEKQGVSRSTMKNYLSDVSQFLDWACARTI